MAMTASGLQTLVTSFLNSSHFIQWYAWATVTRSNVFSSNGVDSAGQTLYSILVFLIALSICAALISVAITFLKCSANTTAACPLPVAQSHAMLFSFTK